MTIDRMVELLKIEHECMLRKSHGDCNGRCEDCELVQDDGELHEMYENVIGLIESMEPVKPYRDSEGAYFCGTCMETVVGYKNVNTNEDIRLKNYCSECGKKVKWDG